MDIKINTRGQVTIFVIIGILIVAAILLVLFLSRGEPDIGGSPDSNPEAFMINCLEDSLMNAEITLSESGGYVDPELNIEFEFEGEAKRKIGYLCYTSQYDESCVNQEPLLFRHIEDEIIEYIGSDVRNCWDRLGQDLEDEGYVVQGRYQGYELNLKTDRIEIPIEGEITIMRNDGSSTIDEVEIYYGTQLHETISLVQEIVSQEVSNCGFDDDYLDFYGEYRVDKTQTLDGSDIYTIKDDRENIFRFAVRGCVNSPGY